MPNKTYWNQVRDIMEFTDAMGQMAGEECYRETDKKEMQEILADVKERSDRSLDEPMEMITLSGLAIEFKEVAKETRANYHNAETEEEKQEILDEVLECTSDFFSFLAEEASEVFGEAKNRLHEATKDNVWDEETW